MNFKINTKKIIILSSLAVAVVLFTTVFKGARAGKDAAQSDAIIKTVQNISIALDYFYSDQNRYPSVLEFDEQNIMLSYLNIFPLPNFVSELCPENFIYKRNSASVASLSFCLPRSVKPYAQGWNALTLKK